MPPTYTLSPAEFHSETKWEYSNTISLTKVCSMTKDYHCNGFDKFWNDVPKLTNQL